MSDPKGFLKHKRQTSSYRPVHERVRDYNDVIKRRSDPTSQEQGLRCMDCGTPFCHWGCPLANIIPEWNEFLGTGHWQDAYNMLIATNVLPEITGRVCPALCEYACVLGVTDDPVTIRENELCIIEHAFAHGIITPHVPSKRTGKKIAVIGSGPSGLSAAAYLNRMGHSVTVFEKDDALGGILRYGIPDFKLEKNILDRRIKLFEQEGIVFKTGVHVGVSYPVEQLLREFDAVCCALGSRTPRDLNISGRNLHGIHFAMDYLTQSNRRNAGKNIDGEHIIATGKHVVVIGGGDTGSDCVGTANRQSAASVTQIELLPQPSECRTDAMPWPYYPMILRTSSSHEEGCERKWNILTQEFLGENGHMKGLRCEVVSFGPELDTRSCPIMKRIPDSSFELTADLIILAMGFVGPEKSLLTQLGVTYNERGNIATQNGYATSVKGVFAAGDARRGASLVVWAIKEGKEVAEDIDTYLGAI